MKIKYLIFKWSLVKKKKNRSWHKITEIKKKLADHNHDKYITTPKFNTLAADLFNGRLVQANLITKTDFDVKLLSRNRKIAANISKHLLVENELKKLKTFDSTYYRGKSHFEEDGTQNYLVFQPMYRYFKRVVGVGSGNYIYVWKSKGMSDENVTSLPTSDYSFNLQLSCFGTKTRLEFKGSCLKHGKLKYTHGKTVKIYNVYELTASYSNDNDSTLKNSLFGAVKLTKNADIDEYGYFGYGIGFDRRSSFLFPGGGFGQNVIIFGVDMSSSIHFDNKKKDILIIGKGATQDLEHILTAEKMYSINFTKANTKFCLSLRYNGANSHFFVNGTEIYKFIAKDSGIVASQLFLGNISKDWSVDNMKRTGFNGYVYHFSVDYDAIAFDDMLGIHKYLVKKNDIV